MALGSVSTGGAGRWRLATRGVGLALLSAVCGCGPIDEGSEAADLPNSALESGSGDECDDAGACTGALDGAESSTAKGRLVSGHTGGKSDGTMGTTRSELITTERTVLQETNRQIAETRSSVFQNASDEWEMVFGSNENLVGGAQDPAYWDYGCARDAYTTWCDYRLSSSLGQFGPDPSFAFRAGPTKYLYEMLMRADNGGFRMMRTTEPCPTNCGGTSWSVCNISQTDIDFPTLLSKDDEVWFTYIKSNGTNNQLYVGRMNEPWCSSWSYWADNCSSLSGAAIGMPRAAFDSSGDMHIIFQNHNDLKIQHQVFRPGTGFLCDANNPKNIADYLPPPTKKCLSCDRLTLSGLGSSCLRYESGPEIAIDKTASPNTIVATLTARGANSCDVKQEQRWYRSTDSGHNWSYRQVTGCKTSIFVGVDHYSAPGAPYTTGLFQSRSSYVPPGDNRLREVRWRSADAGLTWSGIYRFI